jgi:CRISPR-associated protein Cst1
LNPTGVTTLTPLLFWTGHALADVGIAALLAIRGKSRPEDLDEEDLANCAALMERIYFSGVIGNYLTCVFPNSEYVQPGSGAAKDAKRKQYARDVLFAFQATKEIEGAKCAFSGNPATHKINRVHLPLITGKDVLNFFPNGEGGLFISGPYLTALQALPLGGRRCEGRLLIAHSDHSSLTLAFARLYWRDNQRLLNLAATNSIPTGKGADPTLIREMASEGKFPDAKAPKTLLLNDLQALLQEASMEREEDAELLRASVTAYWLSNSGQGPSIDIFQVPNAGLRVLAELSRDPIRGPWKRLLQSGWAPQTSSKVKKSKDAPAVTGAGLTSNAVLQRLFAIFEDGDVDTGRAAVFVNRYLLGRRLTPDKFLEWAATPSWLLAEFFLNRLLGMTQERLDRIRTFADRLAQYIETKNDKGLLRSFMYGDKEWQLRNALVKAQRHSAAGDLLFGLQDYLDVFMAEDGMGRESWGLVRDLIAIRIVETLHRAGYLSKAEVAAEIAAGNEGA